MKVSSIREGAEVPAVWVLAQRWHLSEAHLVTPVFQYHDNAICYDITDCNAAVTITVFLVQCWLPGCIRYHIIKASELQLP